MNSDPLDQLWRSADNQPPAEAAQRLAARFVTRVRRRRRFHAWWLAWTSALLTVATVLAATHLARHGLAGVRGQWMLLPMLVLPWAALAVFLRAFFRERTVAAQASLPLGAALRAAQASNTAERRHVRLVGGLFAVMAPLTAVAVWQLRAAGKLPGDQAWSMALAFGVIFALGALGLALRYRCRLLPERRLIEARLHDLDTPVAG